MLGARIPKTHHGLRERIHIHQNVIYTLHHTFFKNLKSLRSYFMNRCNIGTHTHISPHIPHGAFYGKKVYTSMVCHMFMMIW